MVILLGLEYTVFAMTSNLSSPVSSKKTAQNTLYRFVLPLLSGFFHDEHWKGPSQLFNSIRALGGDVSIESTQYFNANGVDNMGKRWYLMISANGFMFPAILTASFADKPMGETYDLTLTV